MQELKNKNGDPSFHRSIRNFWINPGYQSRYIFWLTVSGLVLIIANSAIFYSFTRENYALLVDLCPMTDEARIQLYQELGHIIRYLVGGNLLFLLAMTIVGLVFSHRTAGPMVQYLKIFKGIRSGDTNLRLHLRPKDEFQDVAQAFNEMMDSLTRRS